MKTVSFVVPCFNSAEYMRTCVDSILPCGEDIEIILVNDGSTKDNTAEIADELAAQYPGIVRAIHQENAGHGGAVNTGLAAAEGLYFKVVDSDDWLDEEAMVKVMDVLRGQARSAKPVDLVITNYIYDKVYEGTKTVIDYTNVFPVDQLFTWDQIGHFHNSQYLLMHSAIYRTEVLKSIGLQLPTHCFYVDNIFVYVPLPACKTMIYLNEDVYHYFIGREDQSVNEKIMYSRIDQQLKITRVMIDSVDLWSVREPKLRRYMRNYMAMMMCICSIFLRMERTEENEAKRAGIWEYLKQRDPRLYRSLRASMLGALTNIPTEAGRRVGLAGYRVAQKIFKFN